MRGHVCTKAHSVVSFFFSLVFPLYPHCLLPDHSPRLLPPLALGSPVFAADAVGKVVQNLEIQSPAPLVLDTTEPLFAAELHEGVSQMDLSYHCGLHLFVLTRLRNGVEPLYDAGRRHTGTGWLAGFVSELGPGYCLSWT